MRRRLSRLLNLLHDGMHWARQPAKNALGDRVPPRRGGARSPSALFLQALEPENGRGRASAPPSEPVARSSAYRWLVALGLSWVTLGCGRVANRPLTVGMELDYPPFEMKSPDGQPSGISVELAHALGDHLHRPVVIENIPFDGLIPALKTGKIDLVISSMTATPERAQSIDFSEPYAKTGICLLLRKDSPLTGVADLDRAGARLAVKKGTTGHLYAAEHFTHATLLVFDKEAACVLEVVEGKADAFLYDQLSIYRNWERHRDTTRPVLEPVRAEYWAIGLRKGNDTLREPVNAFLRDFRASGGFDRLADKYLPDQKTAFRERGVSFLFDK